MIQPLFKSEVAGTRQKKKRNSLPVPKTPGGWAVLALRGSMKEIQNREKRRLPR